VQVHPPKSHVETHLYQPILLASTPSDWIAGSGTDNKPMRTISWIHFWHGGRWDVRFCNGYGAGEHHVEGTNVAADVTEAVKMRRMIPLLLPDWKRQRIPCHFSAYFPPKSKSIKHPLETLDVSRRCLIDFGGSTGTWKVIRSNHHDQCWLLAFLCGQSPKESC
jgi:hypothetical protein